MAALPFEVGQKGEGVKNLSGLHAGAPSAAPQQGFGERLTLLEIAMKMLDRVLRQRPDLDVVIDDRDGDAHAWLQADPVALSLRDDDLVLRRRNDCGQC